MTAPLTARDRFVAFRRSLPRAPRLHHTRVAARGLEFAVFTTPAVHGATPLVCVNGGLLFSHKLLWPALSPLAQHRQLIFYDQRGRGESSAPPGAQAARIEHDAGDLAALRTALGYRRWDVLGHSWGGGIALLGVEQDQGGVRRLVLVDAVGPRSASWLPNLHDAALARLSAPQRAVLQHIDPVTLRTGDPAAQSAYSRAMYPAWFADPEMAQLFVPPRSESRTGGAVAAQLRRVGYDWSTLVRAVQVETLVIHGADDLLPPSVAAELVALLPNARLSIIPQAGHMPFWEQPHAFFSQVEQFLGGA
ncbi:MAG: alpha/beta hydrolase [Gemmatimonadaceae bacterium]|nr:alpha/beta hydrolase [Gemmatimonadaceae bacterium]